MGPGWVHCAVHVHSLCSSDAYATTPICTEFVHKPTIGYCAELISEGILQGLHMRGKGDICNRLQLQGINAPVLEERRVSGLNVSRTINILRISGQLKIVQSNSASPGEGQRAWPWSAAYVHT